MTTYTDTRRRYYQTHRQQCINIIKKNRLEKLEKKHQNAVKTPTPLELAWAAGIVDGEGYIGIIRRRNPKREYPLYITTVAVKMTDKKAIQKLQNMFGIGSIGYHVQPPGNRKPVWSWRCQAYKAKVVLQNLLPFLVTKYEQTKYCLEFLGRRTIHHETQYYNRTPRAELEQREFFCNLLRGLNKRGK